MSIDFIAKRHIVNFYDVLFDCVEKPDWNDDSKCELCGKTGNIAAQCSNCKKLYCLDDFIDIFRRKTTSSSSLCCFYCFVILLDFHMKIKKNAFSKLFLEKSTPLSYMLKDLANQIFTSNLSKNKQYKGGLVFILDSIDTKKIFIEEEIKLLHSFFRVCNIPISNIFIKDLRVPKNLASFAGQGSQPKAANIVVEHVVFLVSDNSVAQYYQEEVEKQLSSSSSNLSLPPRTIYFHYIDIN